MRITSAKYIKSAVDREGMIDSSLPQIAIAGRSNVGKSSFINALTNNSKLCRTSSEPGRTRMVNYFEINGGELLFVDLPGYGYAKASRVDQEKWEGFIYNYFNYTKSLANTFLLVDLRHPPQDSDLKMVNMLNYLNIPFTVIATKSDKLSRSQIKNNMSIIASGLRIGIDNIYPVSSEKKEGLEAVVERIESILNNTSN